MDTTTREALEKSRAAHLKFIDKVKSGRARSVETYAEAQAAVEAIDAALTSLSAAPQGVVKKPKCPHCGSTNLFMFDSDNDICGKCEKYFPAVLPATLILGNGFSEETVRKMLEEFIAQSENASEIDWLKQCAAKYGIEL